MKDSNLSNSHMNMDDYLAKIIDVSSNSRVRKSSLKSLHEKIKGEGDDKLSINESTRDSFVLAMMRVNDDVDKNRLVNILNVIITNDDDAVNIFTHESVKDSLVNIMKETGSETVIRTTGRAMFTLIANSKEAQKLFSDETVIDVLRGAIENVKLDLSKGFIVRTIHDLISGNKAVQPLMVNETFKNEMLSLILKNGPRTSEAVWSARAISHIIHDNTKAQKLFTNNDLRDGFVNLMKSTEDDSSRSEIARQIGKMVHNNVEAQILFSDRDTFVGMRAMVSNSTTDKTINYLERCISQLEENRQKLLFKAVKKGHVNVVGRLIDGQVNIDYVDENGTSPMHMAAYYGHKDVFDLLILSGAKHEVKDNNRETPLHKASKMGHITICQDILERNVDGVNDANLSGVTALHFAVMFSHLPICKLLLDNNANKKLITTAKIETIIGTFNSGISPQLMAKRGILLFADEDDSLSEEFHSINDLLDKSKSVESKEDKKESLKEIRERINEENDQRKRAEKVKMDNRDKFAQERAFEQRKLREEKHEQRRYQANLDRENAREKYRSYLQQEKEREEKEVNRTEFNRARRERDLAEENEAKRERKKQRDTVDERSSCSSSSSANCDQEENLEKSLKLSDKDIRDREIERILRDQNKSLCEVFGVNSPSSSDKIMKAYKRTALKVHPDKNPENPDATEAFQIISDRCNEI